MDLPDLSFSNNQDALVAAVAAANPHTVVVIESGGAQVMPWLANVGAVLEAWYPGQRGGEAIANLLFGDVNPSGKLPITVPGDRERSPASDHRRAACELNRTVPGHLRRELPGWIQILRRQVHHASIPVRLWAFLHNVYSHQCAAHAGFARDKRFQALPSM